MIFKKDDPRKAELIGIAQEIVSLEQTQGWKHFVKTAEAFAETHTPNVHSVNDQNHAIELASRLAFASGVRACIGLVAQQKEILKSLIK